MESSGGDTLAGNDFGAKIRLNRYPARMCLKAPQPSRLIQPRFAQSSGLFQGPINQILHKTG